MMAREDERSQGSGSGSRNSKDDPLQDLFDNLSICADEVMQQEGQQTSRSRGGTVTRVNPNRNISTKKVAKVTDVPLIMHCLKVHEANAKVHLGGFKALTALIAEKDEQAKLSFVTSKGIKSVIEAIWNFMADPHVQLAAIDLLWVTAASREDGMQNNSMTESNADGITDALMISMQTNVDNQRIQRAGCGVLSCLSSAAATQNNINDGTASGAVLTVVNAMDHHRENTAVQYWGLRALFSQCVYSDSNKVRLAKSVHGGTGAAVIHRAMLGHEELIISEWACKLYWALSSCKEATLHLTETVEPVDAILKSMRRFSHDGAVMPMLEAALGALSNFAMMTQHSHRFIVQGGGVALTMDAMKVHSNHLGIQTQACSLMANLGNSAESRTAVVRAGGVHTILIAMRTFSKYVRVQEEACRALTSFCINAVDVKLALSSEDGMFAILTAMEQHPDNLGLQQMACALFSTLSMRENGQRSVMMHGGLSAILSAMGSFPRDGTIQSLGTGALRNLSSLEENCDRIMESRAVEMIVRAMHTHATEDQVQNHACATIWHLSSKATKNTEAFAQERAIQYIVKAMQSLLESPDLQECAAGALWSISESSYSQKKAVAQAGGVDAIVCILFIHLMSEGPVEKAVGILSAFSAHEEFAIAIADAAAINAVMESMEAHKSSVSILEFGCLFMMNMSRAKPEYADETVCAVSVILEALRTHPDAVSLQREACRALWAMSAFSEECRKRIMAGNGMDLIMKSLEHNNFVSEVQEAAKGAVSNLVYSD